MAWHSIAEDTTMYHVHIGIALVRRVGFFSVCECFYRGYLSMTAKAPSASFVTDGAAPDPPATCELKDLM